MAIITLPTNFSFTSVSRFGLTRNSNVLRSKYTAVRQVLVFPYAIWEFEGTLVEYDGANANAVRSFLVQLEGVQNKFKLPVPGYTKPTTGYISVFSVNLSAAVGATSVSFAVGTASTAIFNDGDYFTINDELKMVVGNAVSDGSAKVVVNFKPALRKAVTGITPCQLLNPYCLMSAVDDDVANWALKPPFRHGLKLKAIEAIELP